jgi:hypothetical protein
VEQLLLAGAAGQPAAVGDCRVFGTRLRFLHRPAAAAEPGLWVERVPCPHARGLLPVARLLRQAAVFSQLFRSCFDAASLAGPAAAHGVPTFEVSARAPERLELKGKIHRVAPKFAS